MSRRTGQNGGKGQNKEKINLPINGISLDPSGV